MKLVKIHNTSYNLDYLVKYVEHVGQHEVGTNEEDPLNPRPAFEDFSYFELIFVDGSRVTLDEAQTEAFRLNVEEFTTTLDLDRVDEELLGSILVKDSESGDIIVSPETLERDEESGPGSSSRRKRSLSGSGMFGPGIGSITQDGM